MDVDGLRGVFVRPAVDFVEGGFHRILRTRRTVRHFAVGGKMETLILPSGRSQEQKT